MQVEVAQGLKGMGCCTIGEVLELLQGSEASGVAGAL